MIFGMAVTLFGAICLGVSQGINGVETSVINLMLFTGTILGLYIGGVLMGKIS